MMEISSQQAAYRAHTNIALIKYWGKRNDTLFLPVTSSLSLTLDAFYTETHVSLLADANDDIFFLNDQQQPPEETRKISRFVDLFRNLSQNPSRVLIKSQNFVPTAAGLASSASAFSALGLALNDVFDLHFPKKKLSTLVRQGSGSATRSLFGGFVLWHQGQDDDSDSSYSEPLDPADWDIQMLVVAINKKQKKISSREGMHLTVQTSPYYQLWPQEVAADLSMMTKAIKDRNFVRIGEIAEHNAMKMHATTLAAQPPFTYFEPDSLIAMAMVRQLRDQGIPCYFTMDAGPNIKILCQKEHISTIKNTLLGHFKEEQLILASPGPDPVKLI